MRPLYIVEEQAGPVTLMKLRTGEYSKEYSELRMHPVQDFLSSGPGRFLFKVLARGEPHKLFSMAQIGYSTAVTYGKREYKPTSPKSGVLRAQGDMIPPAFHEGLFIGSLKLLNIRGRAWARPRGIDCAEYDITWN
jgi:uncharacterized protein (TIGR02265 family)